MTAGAADRHRRAGTTLGAAAVLLALLGCAGPEQDAAETLTVFAAASLHEVFQELGADFTAEHPQVEVVFSFAGSADLVAQVDAGAPADVLATADEQTMARAERAGVLAGRPVPFAGNHLTLVTPADNPAEVTGFDRSLHGAAVVVCAPQVPCGAAARTLSDRVDVELDPVSEESSVTDVLGKVTSGQADAGLVYSSDAAAAGAAVRVFAVPGAEQVVNTYPAAVVAGTAHRPTAEAWVEWLTGPRAQAVLQEAGFTAP